MTITEIQLSRPNFPEQQRDSAVLFPPLDIPGQTSNYTAEFVTQDYRDSGAARQIELETFTILGEAPEEVKADLKTYDPQSVFVLLKERETGSQPGDKILGMARFIMYSPEIGNKTFNDLATLVEQDPGLAPHAVVERMQKGENLPEALIDAAVELYDLDITKVMDIATLAPDTKLDRRVQLDVLNSLLLAMDTFGFDLYRRGQMTHVTQFTVVAMHNALKSRMEYPLQELFGLTPLTYDTFGNGQGPERNIVAVPSIMDMRDLEDRVIKSGDRTDARAKHMAALLTHLTSRLVIPSKDAA